ncbi:MAG: HipA N-terminal domain-containing protein [Aequoribacter sp.]|jgi:serine/threonine-protein kinase HipA|uniref:HipA N-terminal domain-containing protein n=1 Tax=Aequoribacter sp. TaxID=2847771 RepID=UPI003C389436
MNQRVAQVFYNRRRAGTLWETERGFHFQYDRDYLAGGPPISFTLPLREEAFDSHHLHGFFENLVAEGWLRKLQTQEQRIDESDRFGLLLANGRDLVGAVTVGAVTE